MYKYIYYLFELYGFFDLRWIKTKTIAVRMDPKMAPPIAAPMIGPGEQPIMIRRTVQFQVKC